MIRVLRLTDAQRIAYGGLEIGRFCFCTDTNLLYIGTSAGDALAGGGGGASDFTDLGDVPAAYAGMNRRTVRVNNTPDALEFMRGPANIAARFYLNTQQNNIAGAEAQVQAQIDAETYDYGSNFNTGTYAFTVPCTGLYAIHWNPHLLALSNGTRISSSYYIDAVLAVRTFLTTGVGLSQSVPMTDVRQLTAAEVLTFYVSYNGAGGVVDISAGEHLSYGSVTLLAEL